MNSEHCSLISTHTKCAQFYPLLKFRAHIYNPKQRPFPPNLRIFCYSYIFPKKNTLIMGDIIPTFHSVASQHGGPDSIFLQSVLVMRVPGSVVGIATGYGLDVPGIESRWGRDFPLLSRPALGPNQPPVQWVPGLSRGLSTAGA